jgi:tRNA-specific 2-thiouridylase
MEMDGSFTALKEARQKGNRVIVALSGGVDSATAAFILKDSGFDVIGVTMKNFCYGDFDAVEKSCCSQEAIEDARRICTKLGIVHQVLDVEKLFAGEVIDNFLREYSRLRTPNPCVRCNLAVRFTTLSGLAKQYGAHYVATGHYARIFRTLEGELFIARARSRSKDQSYFLSGLNGGILEKILFPVGGYGKEKVRKIALGASLPVAEKRESQEVCFIPDGDLRKFLSARLAFAPGPIVNTEGSLLGEHEGLFSYTIGQRRSLGISASRPQYVVGFDKKRNALIVGKKEELYKGSLLCDTLWFDDRFLGISTEGVLRAQIRSRHQAAEVKSVLRDGSKFRVQFCEPQKAVTPGQTIAFYKDDLVVGSGQIDEAT